MTTSLARYHARAPRYILNTEDNQLIRLSGAERMSWEEHTEIRDISLTGLSLTAYSDLSPQLGEIIKIQFTVPESHQMACYAVVIRIEALNSYENLIGLHFYKLDRIQRLNLVQGLARKIQNKKENEIPLKNKSSQIIALLGFFMTLICWLTLMKIFYLK